MFANRGVHPQGSKRSSRETCGNLKGQIRRRLWRKVAKNASWAIGVVFEAQCKLLTRFRAYADGRRARDLRRTNPGQGVFGLAVAESFGPTMRAVKAMSFKRPPAGERPFPSELPNCSRLAAGVTKPLFAGAEAVGLSVWQIPTGGGHHRSKTVACW